MNQLSNREPPKLPPGWKAQWDEEYQTFFYINERTGETQWELPTEDATGTATHSESKNTVPSRPVNQGNNDNEQTDRGIGSFVMNQAISSATGSRTMEVVVVVCQSFIMNQVVSSVTGSINTTMDLDLDLVLLDWLVAYYLVVVAITTTTINKIKINLQWVL